MTMPKHTDTAPFIDEEQIEATLALESEKDAARVRDILAKARELHGLETDEVAALTTVSDPELLGEMFEAARYVKEQIYGRRLVLFSPLYISNLCANECLYCAFRKTNKEVKRRALTQEESHERDRSWRTQVRQEMAVQVIPG